MTINCGAHPHPLPFFELPAHTAQNAQTLVSSGKCDVMGNREEMKDKLTSTNFMGEIWGLGLGWMDFMGFGGGLSWKIGSKRQWFRFLDKSEGSNGVVCSEESGKHAEGGKARCEGKCVQMSDYYCQRGDTSMEKIREAKANLPNGDEAKV